MVKGLYAQQTKWVGNGVFIIDNFQEDIPGKLPSGWYDRDVDHLVTKLSAKKRARYHYTVEKEDGNKFLRYSGTEAMHLTIPLQNRDRDNIYHINVYETPILSWKWRAYNLPAGANIKKNRLNDAAASLYVLWGFDRILFKKVPKTVRYVWGTGQPAGTVMSKLFGKQRIIVLKSGLEDKGKWVTINRNIVKDYKRLFGEPPPKTPLAILILSDGDDTHNYIKADYDDIKLKPAKSTGD